MTTLTPSPAPPRPRLESTVADLTRQRSVRLLATGWILALAIVLVLGVDGMPDVVLSGGTLGTVGFQLVQITAGLTLLAVVYWLTRNRHPVDFDHRLRGRRQSLIETVGLWAYAVIALVIGATLGYGLHSEGAVFGPIDDITRADLIGWAGFNLVAFAAIPYFVFRALGYSHRDLGLRSNNLRADIGLILIVLAIEATAELTVFTDIFDLDPTQLLIGMPLAFAIFLAGTGIPILIPIYAILVPRYRQLTGSIVTSTILGGLTYAAFHVTEYWTVYDNISLSVVSVILVFSQFTVPGMIKSILTLRTGNAWVHVWAYHSIVPHVTVDTPTVVDVFEID